MKCFKGILMGCKRRRKAYAASQFFVFDRFLCPSFPSCLSPPPFPFFCILCFSLPIITAEISLDHSICLSPSLISPPLMNVLFLFPLATPVIFLFQ